MSNVKGITQSNKLANYYYQTSDTHLDHDVVCRTLTMHFSLCTFNNTISRYSRKLLVAKLPSVKLYTI